MTAHNPDHDIELNTWHDELLVDCLDCEATLSACALPVGTPHAVRNALVEAGVSDAHYLRRAWDNHVHQFEEADR